MTAARRFAYTCSWLSAQRASCGVSGNCSPTPTEPSPEALPRRYSRACAENGGSGVVGGPEAILEGSVMS